MHTNLKALQEVGFKSEQVVQMMGNLQAGKTSQMKNNAKSNAGGVAKQHQAQMMQQARASIQVTELNFECNDRRKRIITNL